ncbi:hypothetical protein HDU96_003590, partial [Phlyctochytrium bullatum]
EAPQVATNAAGTKRRRGGGGGGGTSGKGRNAGGAKGTRGATQTAEEPVNAAPNPKRKRGGADEGSAKRARREEPEMELAPVRPLRSGLRPRAPGPVPGTRAAEAAARAKMRRRL